MTAERVLESVREQRPNAKFVVIQHSSEFIAEEAELGDGFYTANLYDEAIDANMIVAKAGRVLVQNTYIASFAYNMFLCWLCCHRPIDTQSRRPTLDEALVHNLKKFFAEQLCREHDCIPSRSLFLETLLFEQQMMVGIFAEKEADPELGKDAETAAGLMSFALSMHELGHYYDATKPDMWNEVASANRDAIGPIYEDVVKRFPEKFVTEFRCDAIAVVTCFRQYEAYAGPLFALRTIVFAFACYAAMYSAVSTAKATCALWKARPPETVDFKSIEPDPPGQDDEMMWKLDANFVQRAKLVADLCERIASLHNLVLHGQEAPFPLPTMIVEYLLRHVGKVFDCSDDNARKMSRLVAKALHGHSDGMEYLYLRSKVFKSNRPGPLLP